ncbi:phosphotransferase [Thermoproteota archaeon]
MKGTLEQKLSELEQKLGADITPEEKFELAKIYKEGERFIESQRLLASIVEDDATEEVLMTLNDVCVKLDDMEILAIGHYNLAVVYGDKGNINEAVRSLLRSVSLCFHADSELVDGVVKSLGELALGYEDPASTAELAHLTGSKILSAYYKLSKSARTSVSNTHIEHAKIFFEMAIEHNPEYAHSYRGLAHVCTILDDLESSAENYEKSLKLGATTKEVIKNLAITYYKLGKYSDAAAIFRRKAELSDSKNETPSPHLALGQNYLEMMERIKNNPYERLTEEEIEELAVAFTNFASNYEEDFEVLSSSYSAVVALPKIYRYAVRRKMYHMACDIAKDETKWAGCNLVHLSQAMWKKKDYMSFAGLIHNERSFFNMHMGEDTIRKYAHKLLKKGEVEHAHTLLAEGDITSIDDDDLKLLGLGYLEKRQLDYAWSCFTHSATMTTDDWERVGDIFLNEGKSFIALDAFKYAGREDKVRDCLGTVIQRTTDQLFEQQRGSTRDVIFKELKSVLEVGDVKLDEDHVVVDSNNDVSTLNIKYDLGEDTSEKRTFVVKQFDIDESEKNRQRYRNEKKILTELEELGVDVAPTAFSGYETEHTALLVMSYVGDKTLRDVLTSSMGEEHLLNTVSAIAKLHTLSPMAVFEEIDRCKADPAYLEENVRQHFLGKTFNRYAKFLGLEEDDLASERTRELIKASASAAMKDPEYFHPTHHNNVVVSDKGVTLIDFESMVIAHPCLNLSYLTEYGVNDGSGFRAIEDFEKLKEHYIETRYEFGRECEWVDDHTQGLLQLYTHMAFLGSMLRDVQTGADTIYAREKALYHIKNIREKSEFLSSKEGLDHVIGMIQETLSKPKPL